MTWLLVQCFSSPERKADTLCARAMSAVKAPLLYALPAFTHLVTYAVYFQHTCPRAAVYSPPDIQGCNTGNSFCNCPPRSSCRTLVLLLQPWLSQPTRTTSTSAHGCSLEPVRTGTPRPPSYAPYLASASSSLVRRAYHQRWPLSRPKQSLALPQPHGHRTPHQHAHVPPPASRNVLSTHTAPRVQLMPCGNAFASHTRHTRRPCARRPPDENAVEPDKEEQATHQAGQGAHAP